MNVEKGYTVANRMKASAAAFGVLLWLSASAGADVRKSENVVLVTIDGLRWQEVFTGAEAALIGEKDKDAQEEFLRKTPVERRRALMPFLWNVVASRGRLWGNRERRSSAQLTNGHKFSYPGYQELLAGYPDPRVDSNQKIPNPNVTVLEWLNRRPGFEGRVAAFGSWDRLSYILNRERSGLYVNSTDEELKDVPNSERQAAINDLRKLIASPWKESYFDGFAFYAAMDYLRSRQPRVLYLLYEEPDEWGHAKMYSEYLRSTKRIDVYLRRMWESLQAMPEYKDKTTLIVTTDHGRGKGERWKDHDAEVEGAEDIWIAAMGPSVSGGGELSDVPRVTQSQIAATVAAALGEDYIKSQKKAAPPLDLGR